jgi:TolB protein
MDARVGSDETIIGRYSTNGDYVEDHQHPSWYPSANKLAFAGFTGTFLGEDNYDLYTMTFDAAGNATGTTRLTTDGAIDRFPAVSPDGEKIAFTSDRKTGPSGPGDYEIYVMEADKPEGPDNPAVRLTDNDTDDWSGDWSPDGKKIVYTGRRNGNSEVLVMNASDGTSKKNLTKNAAQDSSPAWSPDGRYIVFVRTHDSRDSKDYEIWKMRADGSDPTRLTRNTLYECCPDWQPRD